MLLPWWRKESRQERMTQKLSASSTVRKQPADAPLLRLWSEWLASLPANGGIVVCHPAAAVIPGDSHAQARLVEFQLMGSAEWKDLLGQLGITVATWRQALAPSMTR